MTPSRAAISIDGNKLQLSGVLDDESVVAVEVKGREWIKSSTEHECCLDLSLVTYSSSAGIALLLGWLRVAREQKKTLRFIQLPATMLALANVSGLDDLFQ